VPVTPEQLAAYARLIVGVGVNLEPGQTLGVEAYVEHAPLARAVTRAAYEAGAAQVDVLYKDEGVRRATVETAPDEALGVTRPWMLARQSSFEGQAYLLIRGHPDPTMFDGLDGGRVARTRHREEDALWLRQVSERLVNWALVASATEGWARAIFGEPDTDRLWEAIFRTVRLDEPDPAAAWREHADRLAERSTLMNERRFDALRYRGPGTDLVIGLLPGSTWQGARDVTRWGREHVANLPSEEIFTTPDCRRADGHVRSTRPLVTSGTLVEGLELRFEDGRIVEVRAERGEDVVRGQVAMDEGSARLGEVALVDGSSRVGREGIVFYETLFDENATSHIAYGQGFASSVEGMAGLSSEEQRAAGIAQSSLHTDFMVGGPEIEIDGLTANGDAVPIVHGEDWQLG
jgi:aminopeptidase